MRKRTRAIKHKVIDCPTTTISVKEAYPIHANGSLSTVPLEFGLKKVRVKLLEVRGPLAIVRSTRSWAKYAVPIKQFS